MGTKSCNRKSKSCSAKYGIFYRFVYMRDSCSARYDYIYSNTPLNKQDRGCQSCS
ncbi:hypothetical protein E2C01_059530 [Portunus trituberculatus]|uniref:Uncharacterized protein n=1 Tax=Portunus trituberculatus TaxID=210409 RepID=A0A5B7H640_PORTR|nr:hypothetical protein [Portunus trituberculatus]